MQRELTCPTTKSFWPNIASFPHSRVILNDYELVLEAGRTEKHYWQDLWRYRELFQVLAWRDISVRYKQTVIGIAWAIIRPLLATVAFTIVFGYLAKLPTTGSTPYALLVFAGMIPWTFVSTGLMDSANSLVGSANLIGKVYFPRLIIPASALCVSLVDMAISLVMFFLMMGIFQEMPPWQIVFLPLFVLLSFLVCFGPGLWLTAITVKYRDFRYLIPFVIQLGMYVSPVGFSSEIVPEKYQLLYSLNPLVGVIDGFRWCLLKSNIPFPTTSVAVSVLFSLIVMALAIRRFRRMESTFADLV